MRISKIAMLAAVAAVGYAAGAIPEAKATFLVTIDQVGSNVVATGSGSLDLAGLTFQTSSLDTSGLDPSDGTVGLGAPGVANTDVYSGAITGPSSFGPGGDINGSVGSGDRVTIVDAQSDLFVPEGYVSGNSLSATSTYDNATFSSLGLTAGTYVYTFGSGANADSFTIDIVAPTVASAPEPASIALLAAGLTGLGLMRRQRKPV